jgi:hypothetical protein
VTGANFISGGPHKHDVVVWSANGETFLSTAFVSSTQLNRRTIIALYIDSLSRPVGTALAGRDFLCLRLTQPAPLTALPTQ